MINANIMENCKIASRGLGSGKEDVARERWRLLAKALSSPTRSPLTLPHTNTISVRRFSSFGLVVSNALENENDCWLKYSAHIGERNPTIELCLLRQHLTATELMGFNNTGNVCVWPSEEVLAWYLLPRSSLFAGKTVLELGGGMTCLAGVLLSRYSQAASVHLTDGNALSVENVRRIVERNALARTTVSQLDWKNYNQISQQTEYWVSQAKKFCDFCKCYYADNKASIEHHEGGRRHKDKVRRRITEMQKKTKKDADTADAIARQMKKMESAALQAYIKDLEAHPDIQSTSLRSVIEKARGIDETPVEEEETIKIRKYKEKKWLEAKTAEDITYYWNKDTGESVWKPPKEGFIAIDDQKDVEMSQITKVKQEKALADLNREIYGTSSRSVKDIPKFGPVAKMGAWKPVMDGDDAYPDLELPELKRPEVFQVVSLPLVDEERPKMFKEKKARVAEQKGPVEIAFKKRKIGGARNARQRGSDE